MHANDPTLKSFVAVAADSHFPIQNLPFGIFSTTAKPVPRVGMAIGDLVLDLAMLEQRSLLKVADTPVFNQPELNAFIALGQKAWSDVRLAVSRLLRHDNPTLRDNVALRAEALIPMAQVAMHLPVRIPGYTDF